MTEELNLALRESFERLDPVLAKRTYSYNYRRGIRSEGNAMMEFFGPDFPVRSIRASELMEYLEHRIGKLSPASANKAQDRIIQWLKFCERAGLGPSRAFLEDFRRPPKPPVEDRVFITREEIGHVLRTAGERDPRDRMLIATLWYTGARPSEVIQMKVGGIDRRTGIIRFTRTKVNDVHEVAFEEGLIGELDLWLPYYQRYVMPSATPLPVSEWALIPNRRRGFGASRFTPDDPHRELRRLVRDTLEAAGFKGRRLGAATLRQSAAMALHDGLTEAGLPDALRRVQAFLGHGQQSTTEGYLDRGQLTVLQRDTAARGILTPAASTPTRVALSNVFNILTGEPVTA